MNRGSKAGGRGGTRSRGRALQTPSSRSVSKGIELRRATKSAVSRKVEKGAENEKCEKSFQLLPVSPSQPQCFLATLKLTESLLASIRNEKEKLQIRFTAHPSHPLQTCVIKFGDREHVVSSRIETRDDFCDCYVETTGGEEHSDGKLAQLGMVTKKLTVQSSRDDSQKKLRKGKEEVEGTKVARKLVVMNLNSRGVEGRCSLLLPAHLSGSQALRAAGAGGKKKKVRSKPRMPEEAMGLNAVLPTSPVPQAGAVSGDGVPKVAVSSESGSESSSDSGSGSESEGEESSSEEEEEEEVEVEIDVVDEAEGRGRGHEEVEEQLMEWADGKEEGEMEAEEAQGGKRGRGRKAADRIGSKKLRPIGNIMCQTEKEDEERGEVEGKERGEVKQPSKVPPPTRKPPEVEDWEGYKKKEADRFGVVGCEGDLARYREQYGQRYKVYKHVNMLMDGYRGDIREKAEEEKSAQTEEEARRKHKEVIALWRESKEVSPPLYHILWLHVRTDKGEEGEGPENSATERSGEDSARGIGGGPMGG